jgi:hypothetical protein
MPLLFLAAWVNQLPTAPPAPDSRLMLIRRETPEWEPYFQVRVLAAYRPGRGGTFRYAEPFDRV